MSAENNGLPDKQQRVQSPSYPVMSLSDAVEHVRKIDLRYRTTSVDRGDAAKLIGYAGMTGPSASAIATLTTYGLIERAGKGEIRVTERARSILHPNSDAERRTALLEAAFSPQLYRDLRDRFPGLPVPPMEGVMTHLNRNGFNSTAVRPATRAFLATMTYLQENGVFESNAPAPGYTQESAPLPVHEEAYAMQNTAPPATTVPFPRSPILNEPSLTIRGGHVLLEALLDLEGLEQLEEQIKALKTLLKPKRRLATASTDLGNEPTRQDEAAD